MSCEIYYGDFGTGKTAAMLKKIRETAEKGRQCMLFVPEQFSFETERNVYFAVGSKNIRYVKVTGFSKLSREILNRYNMANPCADEAVKLITMWKTAENAKEDFLSFGKEKNSSGFCRLMLKTVAAFRNAGISPEEYREILEKETSLDEELSDKAGDFLRIYSDYDKELRDNLHLDDKLDDVSRAAALAEEHGFFKGYSLFFDNYDSFSAVQKKMLKTALSQCENALFCFSCDKLQSKKREFLCVSKTIGELSAIAPETKYGEFKNGFRAAAREQAPVRIFEAKTPYDEADIAAAEIQRMVRDEGFRYRDILVLTADREYESIISRRFDKSGIPVFCDFPHPMTDKPVVDFVLQIFRALSGEPEELIRLAESGFKRINEKGKQRLVFNSEVYRLRSALDAYDLTAEDFLKDWSNDPRIELRSLENLRSGIAEPLRQLKEKLDNAKDGAEFSEIFMRYLIDTEQIGSTFIAASKAGEGGETDYIKVDESTAEEYNRIWEALCEAFTSMAYCLDNIKIDYEKYLSLLEEILSGINLANPPQVLDSVTVGDIERTRKTEPKAVMIMGACEGKIPVKGRLQSIFTQFERQSLNEAGLALYDTELNRWSKEYYFAWRAMNLYGKRLIITFSHQSTSGEETTGSRMLSERFANVNAVNSASLPRDYFINSLSEVRACCAEAYKKDSSAYSALTEILNEKSFENKLDEAARLISGNRGAKLDPKTAAKLFEGKNYSPTKLESAFTCPFMYFCKYGLGLKQYDDKDPGQPSALGSAVHNIMRIALESLGAGIKSKTDKELEEAARDAISIALKQELEKNPTYPERTSSIFGALTPRITNMLKQTRLDLNATGFVPTLFEKEVSYCISDKDVDIRIKGTADRIDMKPQEGKNLVRIYDYKTGSKGSSFDKSGVESGIDLQMLLYLFAECNNDKAIPALVGYFEAKAPGTVSADSTDMPGEEEMKKNWYSDHKINGAVFGDGGTAAAQNYEEAVKNETIVKGKAKYSEMLNFSDDKFSELKEHIEKDIIIPKIRKLKEGDIEAMPLEYENKLPCDYCQLQCICGNKGQQSMAPVDGTRLDQFLKEGEGK